MPLFKRPLIVVEKRGGVLLTSLGRAKTLHVAKGVLVSRSGLLCGGQHAVAFTSQHARGCDLGAEYGAEGRTHTALPAGALLWGAGRPGL